MSLVDGPNPVPNVLAFHPINAHDWVQALGGFAIFGLCAVVFVQTGLLAGRFLPGNSLLFIAGLLTLGAQAVHRLSLPVLLAVVPLCAVAGAQLGHHLGARPGRSLFGRPDSWLFKHDHVDRAEGVVLRYGPAKAVILARFVPVVRTYMNPVVGVLGMPARRFFVPNLIGGVVWGDGVLVLGRLVGDAIGADEVVRYIVPLTLTIVATPLLSILMGYLRVRRARLRPALDSRRLRSVGGQASGRPPAVEPTVGQLGDVGVDMAPGRPDARAPGSDGGGVVAGVAAR